MHARRSHRQPPPQPHVFSDLSSPAVPDSLWCANDFLLGAGMVIIQPSTHKVVLIYEDRKKYWFLPKGRKDIGESLEQAALREAYEESGYQVEFLPLYSLSRAPPPPHDLDACLRPMTEPIFVSTCAWGPRTYRNGDTDNGLEYLTSWYVGQISSDAIPEQGTGMPDEQNYTSHLLNINAALAKLHGVERRVLSFAWHMYVATFEKQARQRNNQASTSTSVSQD